MRMKIKRGRIEPSIQALGAPIKTVRILPVEVWDCGNPRHLHKDEKSANRCVTNRRFDGVKRDVAVRSASSIPNHEQIDIMRTILRRGMSYRRVAEQHITTVAQIREVLHNMFGQLRNRGMGKDHLLWPEATIHQIRYEARYWMSLLDELEEVVETDRQQHRERTRQQPR
jgi:hypothetical protein